MKEHILLKKATRKPYKESPPMPQTAKYNSERGIWMINEEPLVTSEDYPERSTKKCDQETGEDQKGE